MDVARVAVAVRKHVDGRVAAEGCKRRTTGTTTPRVTRHDIFVIYYDDKHFNFRRATIYYPSLSTFKLRGRGKSPIHISAQQPSVPTTYDDDDIIIALGLTLLRYDCYHDVIIIYTAVRGNESLLCKYLCVSVCLCAPISTGTRRTLCLISWRRRRVQTPRPRNKSTVHVYCNHIISYNNTPRSSTRKRKLNRYRTTPQRDVSRYARFGRPFPQPKILTIIIRRHTIHCSTPPRYYYCCCCC